MRIDQDEFQSDFKRFQFDKLQELDIAFHLSVNVSNLVLMSPRNCWVPAFYVGFTSFHIVKAQMLAAISVMNPMVVPLAELSNSLQINDAKKDRRSITMSI